MSVPINYSTGWYSISPAFAWWNNNAHRLAEIKARRETERIIEEDKRKKKIIDICVMLDLGIKRNEICFNRSNHH